MSGSSPIDPQLADVATVLRCLSCGASAFAAAPAALTCGGCGAVVPVIDGIPHVRSSDEDVAISREREAVREMEAAAVIGPTDFSLARLQADDGALRAAFLALPYDDGSAWFRDNEYFGNVARFAGVFDFVLGQLGAVPGGRVLDVGADLTWSTSRLAAAGYRAVGIDINHHLAASQVLRAHGPDFGVVNMDMHLPAFQDGTFDAITAFNALHHTHRLEPLVGTLVAALRPGGRFGVVEPYWHLQAVKDAFGASQIEAGINENVYRLEEWHRIFVQAGLERVTHMVSHAYNAVYEKRTDGRARTVSLAQAEDELFDEFYRSSVTGPPALPGEVPTGARLELPLRVVNRSPIWWSGEGQLPVLLTYHLYRRDGAQRSLVAFENPRTNLGGYVEPGGTRHVRVRVTMPEVPGDYEFEFDLVNEARAWFADRGNAPSVVQVQVR